MHKLIFSSLVFFTIAVCKTVNAQDKNITLSGKVTSFEESLGLEGVSIQVKGSKKSSGTQSDGTYSIIITAEDKVLIFSLDGYQTHELVLPSNKGYDIVLKRTGNNFSLIVSACQNIGPATGNE